jgi:hypothetical protein
MKEDPKSGRVSTSTEELAYYNMILAETLVELLVEKGLLDSDEIKDRLKKVRAETTVDFKRRLQ